MSLSSLVVKSNATFSNVRIAEERFHGGKSAVKQEDNC